MTDTLPPALTPEQTMALLPEVRNCNFTAIDTLIKGHMRLAASIAGGLHYGKDAQKRDDILGVALLALVECVNNVANGKTMTEHDNIGGYISSCVSGQIRNYISTDGLVRPPLNSEWLIKKLKEEGADFIVSLFGLVPYIEPTDEELEDGSPLDGVILGRCDDNPERVIQEFLARVECKRDEIIILLKLQGYTLKEIGVAVEISSEYVRKRLEIIGKELTTYLGETKNA